MRIFWRSTYSSMIHNLCTFFFLFWVNNNVSDLSQQIKVWLENQERKIRFDLNHKFSFMNYIDVIYHVLINRKTNKVQIII